MLVTEVIIENRNAYPTILRHPAMPGGGKYIQPYERLRIPVVVWNTVARKNAFLRRVGEVRGTKEILYEGIHGDWNRLPITDTEVSKNESQKTEQTTQTATEERWIELDMPIAETKTVKDNEISAAERKKLQLAQAREAFRQKRLKEQEDMKSV